ncbi:MULTISPECIES: hypothetical protein [Gluconobacter]|uniref:Uncharacterized protein n=1 Tax=Gluconobacter cadivus TaxID=2728101 RepID=A0ABR9YYR6_9PROT|nr:MULTISPECIES: hypothetical protein [Gluconobacter]MBF0889694.1 hypothetical protein [Gluconobacter cadivus]MBS1061375.1 hypothetical protein [Gluconobacter sp. Dm-44]
MEDIILSYDEMASLRSFLIATVFNFFDAIEMETIGYYDPRDILTTASKIYSIIRFDIKEYKNPFSGKDCDIIQNCILHGQYGLGIYSKLKQLIDYETCDFSEVMDKLYLYIKENIHP